MPATAVALPSIAASQAEPAPPAAPVSPAVFRASAPAASAGLSSDQADPATLVNLDINAVLHSLSVGDQTAARADVARLENDLTGYQASLLTARAAAFSALRSPLDSLVSDLSRAAGPGFGDAALNALSSYLLAIGRGSGNVLQATV